MTIWRLGVVAASRSGEIALGTYVNGYTSLATDSVTTDLTSIFKMSFATETMSTLAAGINPASRQGVAYASSTHGFFVNGIGGVTRNKLQLSNDSVSQLPTNALTQKIASGGGQSSTAGYNFGGVGYPGFASLQSIEKHVFSDDSRSTIPATLSNVSDGVVAMLHSTAAYVCLGNRPPLNPNSTTIDKFTFSSDSRSTLPVGTSATRNEAFHFSNSSAGYAAGNGSGSVSIDKLTFSNETISTLGATLSPTQFFRGGSFASTRSGYGVGGTPGTVDTIIKFPFATETRATFPTVNPVAVRHNSGFSTAP